MDAESVQNISPAELAEWLKTRPDLVLLDVREPFEVRAARLNDPRVIYVPLSVLAQSEQPALPEKALNPAAEIVVFCHHGLRSWQVAWWLQQIGRQHVYNLSGGLDAYARDIDPQVGFY